MKRVVTSTYTSEKQALTKLANRLKANPDFRDCSIYVNTEHRCVDIIFPDATRGQGYVSKGEPVPRTYSVYQYVGPGQGEYKRIVKHSTRNTWNDDVSLYKHVDEVGNDIIPRREE